MMTNCAEMTHRSSTHSTGDRMPSRRRGSPRMGAQPINAKMAEGTGYRRYGTEYPLLSSPMSSLVKLVGRALRETGQAIDRVGLRAIDKPVFKEKCTCPL